MTIRPTDDQQTDDDKGVLKNDEKLYNLFETKNFLLSNRLFKQFKNFLLFLKKKKNCLERYYNRLALKYNVNDNDM